MPTRFKVFLDTSALKAARDSDVVFLPTKQDLNWGHINTHVVVHQMAYENQNAKMARENPQGFDNRLHNRLVARLAKRGEVELLVSNEALLEAMGVPRIDFSFYGSPRTVVPSPAPHAGIVLGRNGREHLYNTLRSMNDTRFLELQKLTGAFQGSGREPNKNQLFDAFHLWCAETGGARFFLTHDTKLIRLWASSKYKSECEPIDTKPLIEALLRDRPMRAIPIILEAWRIRRSGRKLTQRFQRYQDVDERFREP